MFRKAVPRQCEGALTEERSMESQLGDPFHSPGERCGWSGLSGEPMERAEESLTQVESPG